MDETQKTPTTKDKLIWLAAYLGSVVNGFFAYLVVVVSYRAALRYFKAGDYTMDGKIIGVVFFLAVPWFVGKRLLEIARAYYPAERETEYFVYGVGVPVLIIIGIVALEQLGIWSL